MKVPKQAFGSTTKSGLFTIPDPDRIQGSKTELRHQTSGLLHDALDEGRLGQLRAEGEAMDSDQAAAYALEAIRRARQSTDSDWRRALGGV
jgi:hypothetical protein